MKRVITALLLAVFAVCVCLVGSAVTDYRTQAIVEAMNEIEEHIQNGDSEGALQLSQNLQKDWEGMHGQLCLFLQHEHLDPLESIFAVLPYYLEQGDLSTAQKECELARTVTEHIIKTERISLENIL